VNVDKSGALRRSRLGWIIYAHRKTAVRSIQDEVLNLSDRRLDLVDESVVFHALFMDGFMSSEHRPGFQKGRDLGVLGAAVYFGWNGFSIEDWHCSSPVCVAAIADN
jgi:hypothetical protein